MHQFSHQDEHATLKLCSVAWHTHTIPLYEHWPDSEHILFSQLGRLSDDVSWTGASFVCVASSCWLVSTPGSAVSFSSEELVTSTDDEEHSTEACRMLSPRSATLLLHPDNLRPSCVRPRPCKECACTCACIVAATWRSMMLSSSSTVARGDELSLMLNWIMNLQGHTC
jgi:hypothetical protein